MIGDRLKLLSNPGIFGSAALLAGIALLASRLLLYPPGNAFVFIEVGILFLFYGLLVLGLNLQYGFTGIINFGHVLFFGVGGYATAMLVAPESARGIALGLPWPIGLAGAIIAAALVAGIVGFASLPLREEYVAIATLAAAELFTDVTANLPSITGGAIGYVSIPQPINIWAGGHYGTFLTSTLLVMIGVLSFGYVVFRRLTDGPYGRVLRAIRADKEITDTIGKHVFRYEMEVFVFAAIVAAIAGSIYALFIGAAAPGLYTADVTFLLWIGMLVGGAGNHRGVLAGLGIVMAFELLTRFLNDLPYYTSQQFGALRLAMIGLLLIVIVRYRPEGIWGNAKEQGIE